MWTLDFFLGGDMKNKMGDDEGAGWGNQEWGTRQENVNRVNMTDVYTWNACMKMS